MKQVTKLSQGDWAYASPEPDSDFSPEHNQRVMDEVNRHNDKMASRKDAEYKEKVKERAQAVAKYIKSIDNGITNASVLEYFGRQELTRLRGEEIMEQLRGPMGQDLKNKLKNRIRNPNYVHA